MSYNNMAEQWATVPAKRDALFCDLTDATPTDETFRLSGLVGKLPCIRHYAPKTQAEVLRALAQKMATAWDGDRIVRVHGGVYRWEFKDWRAA